MQSYELSRKEPYQSGCYIPCNPTEIISGTMEKMLSMGEYIDQNKEPLIMGSLGTYVVSCIIPSSVRNFICSPLGLLTATFFFVVYKVYNAPKKFDKTLVIAENVNKEQKTHVDTVKKDAKEVRLNVDQMKQEDAKTDQAYEQIKETQGKSAEGLGDIQSSASNIRKQLNTLNSK